jgi:hypothetical protein
MSDDVRVGHLHRIDSVCFGGGIRHQRPPGATAGDCLVSPSLPVCSPQTCDGLYRYRFAAVPIARNCTLTQEFLAPVVQKRKSCTRDLLANDSGKRTTAAAVTRGSGKSDLPQRPAMLGQRSVDRCLRFCRARLRGA